MSVEDLRLILADPDVSTHLKGIFGSNTALSITALVLSVLSIIASLLSARYIFRQTTADHERSRRMFAINMLQHWVNSIQKETAAVNKFVERLSPSQCAALAQAEAFQVGANEKPRLVALLKNEFPGIDSELKDVDGLIKLEAGHVQQIRSTAMRYLNNLETVMTAWVYSIADKEIIVRQFQYLVDEREGMNAMLTFRQKVGSEHWPSIGKFAKHIERVREQQRELVGRQEVI
ncbi:MAG: hypothetical protein ABL908_22855 [Hyphomicrobium sp.]